MEEKIIETKQCRQCQTSFAITDKDLAFYDKMSPVFAGKKYSVPPPTLCPTCRTQRRLSYRNDRSLYKSVSSLTGKEMISMHNPAYGYVVYEQEDRWTDKRDPTHYGATLDPTRSFFEQYGEVIKKVPRFNLFNLDGENCNYVNYAPHCKNCYLLFGSWFDEECYYGQTLNECKDCIDTIYLDKSELCYENIDGNSNYNAFFCQNCINTTKSYFCFDCENVSNCIGCYNLRNKEYHILNKPVSKEEFAKEAERFSSYAYLMERKQFYQDHIQSNAICKSYRGEHNEHVSGDFIFESKNIKHCFSTYRSEDLAYCARMFDGKDSYDFDGWGYSTLTYENMSNDFSHFCISCTTCEHLTYCFYCDLCFHCDFCFGCIGLRNKQYCILNTQYTKDEYEQFVPQIIERMKKDGERGEFLFGKYSTSAYNETIAHEYFPLTKAQAISRWYKWLDDADIKSIPQTYDIPDDIHQVTDEILQQVLQCPISKKNFKIIPQELAFYRKMQLPIPRLHPDIRHKQRLNARNPRRLWDRKCMKCWAAIQTAYAPERKEKVYCEACYNKELYS